MRQAQAIAGRDDGLFSRQAVHAIFSDDDDSPICGPLAQLLRHGDDVGICDFCVGLRRGIC